ncbi:MAG: discoidin domain-containing protein, partial [Verrucomicrobiae bacterium]|nr:discoidin domain-containing protein [Verrucomicrobiae bacterium]
AYDGYIETRWDSEVALTGDMWWQLDLGRIETFKTIDAETSPAGLTIELSADGNQWRPMDPAAARHEARFIRLRPAPAAPTQEPWRIFEVTVRP